MHRKLAGFLLFGAVAFAACQENNAPTTESNEAVAAKSSSAVSGTPAERAAQLADAANKVLEGRGLSMRVTGATFFTTGQGVDPFRKLRTGSRWPQSELSYILDVSDYTGNASSSAVDAALVSAYNSWNAIDNTSIHLTRASDAQRNPDFLDAINLNSDGTCTLFGGISDTRWNGPYANIVQGGWLAPDYFGKCLGSEDIIAVTWTFSDDDFNHDNYPDIVYVEQYFNAKWGYVTTGSQYLDFDGPFDIESIAVHEDGHALGLGHFGGPNLNEPFKLQPNGTVFDPEAVMNPFSLGGEKRNPFPTDVSALRTLYVQE
jgi:hypothetical protein